MIWSAQLAPELIETIKELDIKITPMRRQMEEVALVNQSKVLTAFRRNQLSESHFAMSTGYGYDDLGRDTLESIYPEVFNTEDAIIRP